MNTNHIEQSLVHIDATTSIPVNDPLLYQPPFPTGSNQSHIPPNPSLYSTSGLDVISLLHKVVNRPNPQIQLGPIDLSCSFVICSAQLPDNPILYCFPSFEELTGYQSYEALGRNCRFLQSPDGWVTKGSRRKYCDDKKVYQLKKVIMKKGEGQVEVLNYKKNRQPFKNLITVISVEEGGTWETTNKGKDQASEPKIMYFFGFQVDIIEQPNAILKTMKDGSYSVNYTMLTVPNYLFSGVSEMMSNVPPNAPNIDHHPHMPNSQQAQSMYSHLSGNFTSEKWVEQLLQTSDSLIQVITSKGVFVYTSTKCKTWLNYDSTEIVGYSLNDFIHPTDLIPVMREIKECELESLCLTYRIKHKSLGYIWMESVGKAFYDPPLPLVSTSKLPTQTSASNNSEPAAIPNPNLQPVVKPTKYIVLSGRILPTFHLPRKTLKTLGSSLSSTDFWLKLSLDGVILYGDDLSKKLLKVVDNFDFVGKSFFQFLPNHHIPKLAEAFQRVFSTGVPVKVMHDLLPDTPAGVPMTTIGETVSVIYPGTLPDSATHPHFLLLQARPLNNNTQPPIPNWIMSLIDEDENLFKEFDIRAKTHWEYEYHQLKKENQWLLNQIDKYQK